MLKKTNLYSILSLPVLVELKRNAAKLQAEQRKLSEINRNYELAKAL